MQTLTDRQTEVYEFVIDHIDGEGYSPTFQEISDHFGWSSLTSAVQHLRAIERKGFVKKTPRGYLPV